LCYTLITVEQGSTKNAKNITQTLKGLVKMKRKNRTIWAYLDGKKLVDVVKAALDNNMMTDDVKQMLIKENPSHSVTFKCE
jgi:hypothetical protein